MKISFPSLWENSYSKAFFQERNLFEFRGNPEWGHLKPLNESISLGEQLNFLENPAESQQNQQKLCIRTPIVRDAHNSSYLTPKLGFQGRNYRKI